MFIGCLNDMVVGQSCCIGFFCVFLNSWWVDMNYYFFVLLFLGVLKVELFFFLKYFVYIFKLVDVSDVVKEKFCISIEECMEKYFEVIKYWVEFFM